MRGGGGGGAGRGEDLTASQCGGGGGVREVGSDWCVHVSEPGSGVVILGGGGGGGVGEGRICRLVNVGIAVDWCVHAVLIL